MMERWPKDFLRLNLDANRGGNVALRPRLKDGEHPSLVLKGSGQTKNLRRPIVALHTDIRQSASSRNKLLANLLMAKIDLQPITSSKPVVRPGLSSLALATDPTRQQLPLVCVTFFKAEVPVEKTVT